MTTVLLHLDTDLTLRARVDLDMADVRWEYVTDQGEKLDPLAYEEREGVDLDTYLFAALEEAMELAREAS